jgi:hypothetical protein
VTCMVYHMTQLQLQHAVCAHACHECQLHRCAQVCTEVPVDKSETDALHQAGVLHSGAKHHICLSDSGAPTCVQHSSLVLHQACAQTPGINKTQHKYYSICTRCCTLL